MVKFGNNADSDYTYRLVSGNSSGIAFKKISFSNLSNLKNKNNIVEDYYLLSGVIIFFAIYSWFTRNDWKEFFWKSSYEHFNIVRLPFILITVIICVIIKIVKK